MESVRRHQICATLLRQDTHTYMEDLNEAGGVYAVMNELNKKGLLHTDCLTVTGKTVGENIEGCVNKNPEVIRPIDNPYSQTGGLAVLKGNLAPDGSVVKRSAVCDEMLVHEGPARIFESDEEATEAIKTGRINPGDVIVIRYEELKGWTGNERNAQSNFSHCRIWTGLNSCPDHRRTFQLELPEEHLLAMYHRRQPWAARSHWSKKGISLKINIPELKLELDVSDEELRC